MSKDSGELVEVLATAIKPGSGAYFEHWGSKHGSGFRIVHPDGSDQYLYLAPTPGTEEGVAVQKVALMEGSTGSVEEDRVVGHFDVTVRHRR